MILSTNKQRLHEQKSYTLFPHKRSAKILVGEAISTTVKIYVDDHSLTEKFKVSLLKSFKKIGSKIKNVFLAQTIFFSSKLQVIESCLDKAILFPAKVFPQPSGVIYQAICKTSNQDRQIKSYYMKVFMKHKKHKRL